MDEIGELNRRLDEHSQMLLNDSREYARLAREAVDARNAYDLAKARSLLKIKDGTVIEKSAQATLECEPQMIDARIAEAHLDALKMRLRAVSDSLSAVHKQKRGYSKRRASFPVTPHSQETMNNRKDEFKL